MRTAYLRDHSRRIVDTVRRAMALCPNRSASVLDVGRSALSRALLDVYPDVTTLGLPLEVTRHYANSSGAEAPPNRDYGGHIVCDLNSVCRDSGSATERGFDLIVFAEVIEHLHAAPEAVLARLGSMLNNSGTLLCTTPNAASLGKRLKLLMGENPYDRLRNGLDNSDNPGHIREYTKQEMYEVGRAAGLSVVYHEYTDYFESRPRVSGHARSSAAHLAFRLWPAFARYQVVAYRR